MIKKEYKYNLIEIIKDVKGKEGGNGNLGDMMVERRKIFRR
jgi:hypothetical protein